MLRSPCPLDLGGSHPWKVLVEEQRGKMGEARLFLPFSLSLLGQYPVHPGTGCISFTVLDANSSALHGSATAPASGSAPPPVVLLSSCLDHRCVASPVGFPALTLTSLCLKGEVPGCDWT